MAFGSSASRSTRLALSTAVLTGSFAAYHLARPVHAEAPSEAAVVAPEAVGLGKKRRAGSGASASALVLEGGKWSPYVWGSNRSGVLAPVSSAGSAPIKTPRPLSYTGSSPLRDLALAETYGAAVDARGDVWMWGAGYEEEGLKAGASLKGKNISKLSTTPFKVYALSKNGRVYTLSASRARQAERPAGSQRGYPWWTFGMGSWLWTDPGVDVVEVQPDSKLGKGEKFVELSSGRDHVLALTNQGRTFSMPVTPLGNSHFQLGTRLLPPSDKDTRADLADPAYTAIRAYTTLNLINSLAFIPVEQVSAGERSSFVRTRGEGRVLGFGANEYGQIGLGANVAVDIVPTPTEVVLARGYRGGTTVRCLNIAAGANNTFFTVEREGMGGAEAGKKFVDLLASGSGVTGTLGHGLWSSVSGAPVKVKTVSGLQEYSEELQSFIPVNVVHMAISPSQTPHAIATLHTVALSDPIGVQEGKYGNDVMVWGAGGDYQLGNGRRSNLAVPQHLPPLSGPGRDTPDNINGNNEKVIDSGTISPMPHKRLQLHEARADAYDPEGKLIKRNVRCTETMVAGWNTTAVYWKIVE